MSNRLRLVGIAWVVVGLGIYVHDITEVWLLAVQGHQEMLWKSLIVPYVLSFIWGGIATLSGIALLGNWRSGPSLAQITSFLFAVYLLAYLALGGEGHFLYRFILPVVILTLCAGTYLAMRNVRKPAGKPGQTTNSPRDDKEPD